MKEAYARSRDKGFEIVSFTIDDEREDWEQASAEEELRGSISAWGARRPHRRPTRSVVWPDNYLVDSQTGEILAKDLRRHKLDEILEELLP